VQGEQQRGERRTSSRRTEARQHAAQEPPKQHGIERVDGQVDGVEAERRGPQRVVECVGELEQRADSRHRSPPRRECMHGRVVDDDRVVIELERGDQRRRVRGHGGHR
jgi:hypothetical protein